MGITAVELVMEAEMHFDLTIQDEDAEKIITVEQFHSFIWKHVDHERWTEERCWEDLRRIISRVLEVDIEEVTKEALSEKCIEHSMNGFYAR